MQKTQMTRPSPSVLVAAGAALAVLVAVVVGIVTLRHDGKDTAADLEPAAQVASLQQGCQQWLRQDPVVQAPGLCSGLTGWMATHMNTSGMGPQMMWGGPDQMRTTCRQWTMADPSAKSTGDAADWCDSMVDWMNAHMDNWSGRGDWDGWMMHGPMMGR
jgi:hypothetical protein